MSSLIDITNQRFGKLLVLGIDENNKYNTNHRLQWKCICDCGNICYKTTDSLKKPVKLGQKACTQKCGALLNIGQKNNYLTILEPIMAQGKATKYLCQCDCGNTTVVTKASFLNGSVKSCGCYQKSRMSQIGKQYNPIKDIRGIKFGKLTPQAPTDKRQQKSVIWECLCDCGQLHYASLSNLTNKHVDRCSLCSCSSRGEEKIAQLLIDNKIAFVQQKTFEDCRFPDTKAKARFDFFVDNSYLIEFDGIQHFMCTNSGWNTNEHFLLTEEHDRYKTEWCLQNKIPLIRIPYTQLNQLSIQDLCVDTSQFLQNLN